MVANIPERPQRRANVEMQVMPDGSALLYDPRTDQGHVLTALGALVWDMCDGSMSGEAISAECAALLPQQPDTASIVHALLASFQDLHLLQTAEGTDAA
jgi:hypothetical protein